MSQGDLTPLEAQLLATFQDDLVEATVPELAAAAKLAPSEVRKAVTGLVNKHLATLKEDDETVLLTKQAHARARRGAGADGVRVASQFSTEELDQALEEELARLTG